MRFQSVRIVPVLFIIMVFCTACAKKEPVTDLSQGQEGEVLFYSADPTFRDVLVSNDPGSPFAIAGELWIPKEVPGKVPAVVILHTATGIVGPGAEHYSEVARSLDEMGIAAFVVDSHKTRGIKTLLDGLTRITFAQRVADAYAALNLLSTHPRIDRDRIAVIGFAGGGTVSLFSASEKIRRALSPGGLRFAAHIALYPVCFYQMRGIAFTGAPILMLLGEKDDLAPTPLSIDYAKRIEASGCNIKVAVYEGAFHAFDFSILSGNEIPYFYDMTQCQDRYFLLNDDGTWFSPHFNRTADLISDFGDYTADCRDDDVKGTLGGPAKARVEAMNAYKNFLKEVFHLSLAKG
jgi:dienelactone hydrolase